MQNTIKHHPGGTGSLRNRRRSPIILQKLIKDSQNIKKLMNRFEKNQ
jgi:hypothetical protein